MAVKGKKVSELIESTSIDNHFILSHCGKQNYKIPAKLFEYKSGTGINIEDNVVSIDLVQGNGISIDENIISVDLISGNGININDNVISIDLISGNGINIEDNIVSIDLVQGNGINIDGNVISITLTAGRFVEIGKDNAISVKTSDKIEDNSETVPTTKAVWDCVNNLKNYTEGDYISISDETNAISVKYSSSVSDDSQTIPTNKAVFDHALKKVHGEELIHIEYDKEDFKNTINASVKYIDFVVRDDINDYTDSGFILYDDLLNPRYISFANEIVDASFMFQYTDMRKFEIPTPNMVVGNQAFNLCSKLYSFNGNLGSLKDGYQMFTSCLLNESSLNNIATTIQDINHLDRDNDDDWRINDSLIAQTNRGRIDIGYDDKKVSKSSATNCGQILNQKGWIVYFNGNLFNGDIPDEPSINFDISRENGYAPDATQWTNEIYVPYNLTITSVDGSTDSAYNGSEYVCMVEHDYIENATGLWQNNKTLTSWNADLDVLENGTRMFSESALINYDGELNSLQYGEEMFRNCNLGSFNIDLPKLTNGYHMFFNNKANKTLTQFQGDLSSLINGGYMFYGTGISSFATDNLDKLENGDNMFERSELVSFNYDLPSLKNANKMFLGSHKLATLGPNLQGENIDCNGLTDCGTMLESTNVKEIYANFDSVKTIDNLFGYYPMNNTIEKFHSSLSGIDVNTPTIFSNSILLTEYDADMKNLQNGTMMFQNCSNLTTYQGKLDSLMNGTKMFYKTKIMSFTNNLPNLTTGTEMFTNCQFTTFNIELPKLKYGTNMFEDCINLTHFISDLSSLTDATNMFSGCINLVEFNANMNSITNINNVF